MAVTSDSSPMAQNMKSKKPLQASSSKNHINVEDIHYGALLTRLVDVPLNILELSGKGY